jgi:hypothetical protein
MLELYSPQKHLEALARIKWYRSTSQWSLITQQYWSRRENAFTLETSVQQDPDGLPSPTSITDTDASHQSYERHHRNWRYSTLNASARMHA